MEKEEWPPKGTVAFTVRVDKEVFTYLTNAISLGRFKDINEATNILLKEAIETIERRRRKRWLTR